MKKLCVFASFCEAFYCKNPLFFEVIRNSKR